MSEETKPLRDSKGRVLKGQRLNKSRKRIDGEVIEVHPLFPNRSIDGKLLPGQGYRTAVAPVFDRMTILKHASLADQSPERIKTVMNKLYELCLSDKYGPKEQREAIKLYLVLTTGEPIKQINQQVTTQSTSVNVDLKQQAELVKNLSDEELAVYERIAAKAEELKQLPEAVDTEFTVKEDNAQTD